VYSTQGGCKSGWYWFVYSGLWNNGKAAFVGPRPLFMEKESLYLLMFEKVLSKKNKEKSWFHIYNRPIHLIDNYVLKEIIEKHKHLLSLSDSRASDLANMKAILQYHNISIQSNMKTADLKELLLQH